MQQHWKVNQYTEFKIFTTPLELRYIADKMEAWWDAGPETEESTTMFSFFGDKICVDICADQTKLSAEEGEDE